MMTRAYQQFYLNDAQQNLGVMFDYALRILGYDGNRFFFYFIQSDVATKFEHANPKYIAGLSGIDLCDKVLAKVGEKQVLTQNVPASPTNDIFIDQGPEFWTGWILAYYQWYTGLRFSDLQEYGLVPSEILS